jgi:hypothetical protein
LVTPFEIGARVQLQPWVRHERPVGTLVKIGRKYLEVKLDSGPILRRLHPSSLIRAASQRFLEI